MLPFFEEKYSNDLEKRYTGANKPLPDWMKD